LIITDGMRRMYHDGEDLFYYLSLYNENHAMPPMPEGVEEESCAGFTSSSPARTASSTRRTLWQRPDHPVGVGGSNDLGREYG